MSLIDGKAIAEDLLTEARVKSSEFQAKAGRKPTLAVIQVGSNPASNVYVRNKVKACEQADMYCEVHRFGDNATTKEIVDRVTALNIHPKIDGIIVQLPLPKHISVDNVLARIAPEKDVDGLSPKNQWSLIGGNEFIAPCTPLGIVKLLEYKKVPIAGAKVVVIGRSRLVGKPIALMLTNRDATVTVCHSKTRNIDEYTRNADIVIVAVGKPEFLKSSMIKPNAVVVDVGINRVNGQIVGDAAEDIKYKANMVTPVPGGVGPMTVAMLVMNTVNAAANCQMAKANRK